MALIDLKTDLKSLKYSKDRIGGGSSNQPFVQKPIPDSFSAVGNTGGLDVLTRGGYLAFERTADDVSRLSKLLLTPSTFQGPFFTIKQNVLSRQGVQTQASPKGLNEGYYLPTSTLAQATVNSAGLHFNKNGLNPIPGLPGSLITYSDVVTYKQPEGENRLIKLQKDFVQSKTLGNTLRTYPGGPGSILGLGVTTIQTPIEQRTGRNGLNYKEAQDKVKLYPTSYTVTTPVIGEADGLGNVDIEANQFGDPALLNLTNTTEITVSGPESIRVSNNYANLNFLVTASTAAGVTIDGSKSYQDNMPGTRSNIKVITKKSTPENSKLGTVLNVNVNEDSNFAKENFPRVTLYKLNYSYNNSKILLGASISASLKAETVLSGTNRSNALVTIKASTDGYGVNLNSNSTYVQQNFPNSKIYRFQGLTNSGSLLGASVSASLKTDLVGGTPGTKNTNTLVTIKASTNGYGVNPNSNSSYAIANNLTGSLYGPITGSLSNSGRVITPFIRTSEPTVYAGTDFNPVNVTTEDYTAEYTYTAAELQQAPSYRPSGQIQDFREKFRNKGGDALTVGADIIAPSYTEENIENRVHLGNPGTKGDVSNYVRGKVRLGTTEKLGPLDTINALPLYSSDGVSQDNEKPVNDLVKFRIAVLDSGGSSTKTFIHFRAFLDNVSDNYSADWQSYKYVGRGENFYTYSGFERKMSLSWTVYAQSKEELIPMYKKLNFLASTLAPDYNGGFMRGTLVQLTIGGYVYEQPGFITGLNYEITEATPWEIGITGKGFTAPDNLGDDSVKELPHMIKVSGFSFTPIHRFIPQVQKKGTGTLGNGPQQYIALTNGKDNNYDRD
jgi:hypothetical protein